MVAKAHGCPGPAAAIWRDGLAEARLHFGHRYLRLRLGLFLLVAPRPAGSASRKFANLSLQTAAAVTCVRQSAYCTNDGAGNMDCCTGEYSLCTSSMFSSCLDFSASQRGACSGKGPRTICWCVRP